MISIIPRKVRSREVRILKTDDSWLPVLAKSLVVWGIGIPDDVVIEVWASLCLVERDLIDEPTQHLVPISVTTLTKQDEHLDVNKFIAHLAGNLCLTKIAQTVEDVIVPVLTPFVQERIHKSIVALT
jgi:hypothetical protein